MTLIATVYIELKLRMMATFAIYLYFYVVAGDRRFSLLAKPNLYPLTKSDSFSNAIPLRHVPI